MRSRYVAGIIVLVLLVPAVLAGDDFLDEIDRALAGEDTVEAIQAEPMRSDAVLSDVFANRFYRDKLLLLVLMAALLAVPGVFVCLKREFFLSLSVAQAASAGIALGMLAGADIMLMAVVFIAICLAVVAIAREKGVADKNALLFALYTAFAALTTLILSRSGEGNVLVTNLLFGDLVTVTLANARPFIIAGGVTVLLHLLLQRVYVPVIFDPVFAEFEEIPVRSMSFMTTLLQGILLGYAIRLAGMFFALAFLAVVPAAVLMLVRSMRAALLYSALAAVLVVTFSFTLAVLLDYPASAMVAAVSALLFGGVFLFRRG